jgi:O-antigen/teichoic acid export membrane protein
MLAGVGIALPRYIPLYQKNEQPRPIGTLLASSLIYIVGVTAIVCLICLLFSNKVELILLGDSGNILLLLIVLAYAFAMAMSQFAYAYYRGTGNYVWYNGVQLGIQLALILPLIILPALNTTNVFVSWLVVTVVLVCYIIGRKIRIKIDDIKNIGTELKTIVKYSSGRLVADFFLFSLSAFPLIYISNTYGLKPTAYFSVGLTFVAMVSPLFSFIGIILLPYVAECIAKNEMKKANRVINNLAYLYIITTIVITVIIYAFTGFLTSLFFSDSYLNTIDISHIIILSILPQAFYLLYRNPIDAISVVPYNTLIIGVCLVLMIISFCLSTTLTQFAWAYLGISILQGGLSWLTWVILQRRKI